MRPPPAVLDEQNAPAPVKALINSSRNMGAYFYLRMFSGRASDLDQQQHKPHEAEGEGSQPCSLSLGPVSDSNLETEIKPMQELCTSQNLSDNCDQPSLGPNEPQHDVHMHQGDQQEQQVQGENRQAKVMQALSKVELLIQVAQAQLQNAPLSKTSTNGSIFKLPMSSPPGKDLPAAAAQEQEPAAETQPVIFNLPTSQKKQAAAAPDVPSVDLWSSIVKTLEPTSHKKHAAQGEYTEPKLPAWFSPAATTVAAAPKNAAAHQVEETEERPAKRQCIVPACKEAEEESKVAVAQIFIREEEDHQGEDKGNVTLTVTEDEEKNGDTNNPPQAGEAMVEDVQAVMDGKSEVAAPDNEQQQQQQQQPHDDKQGGKDDVAVMDLDTATPLVPKPEAKLEPNETYTTNQQVPEEEQKPLDEAVQLEEEQQQPDGGETPSSDSDVGTDGLEVHALPPPSEPVSEPPSKINTQNLTVSPKVRNPVLKGTEEKEKEEMHQQQQQEEAEKIESDYSDDLPLDADPFPEEPLETPKADPFPDFQPQIEWYSPPLSAFAVQFEAEEAEYESDYEEDEQGARMKAQREKLNARLASPPPPELLTQGRVVLEAPDSPKKVSVKEEWKGIVFKGKVMPFVPVDLREHKQQNARMIKAGVTNPAYVIVSPLAAAAKKNNN